MGHSYYSYTKEELVGNGPKLPVIVMEDNAEVFILWQLKWWMRSENITKREKKQYLSVL